MRVSDYYAGMLRHLATIQEEASDGGGSAPDDGGGKDLGWTDVMDVWVNIGPLSGREAVFAAQLEAAISHRIVMRFRSGIDASMRVVFNGRPFNVRAPINVEERDRWLVLFCDEGVAT